MFVAAIDPPSDADSGGGGKGADFKYPLMSADQSALTVRCSPAWRDDGDALVFIWATSLAFITGDLHALANRLHVQPCAGWVWCKVDKIEGIDPDSEDATVPAFIPPRRMGLGQWSRCEHEHLILCRRGDVAVPVDKKHLQRSVIYAPRGAHSAKPEEAWRVIERTLSAATGLSAGGVEFFSRGRRPGWGAWGHLKGNGLQLWEKSQQNERWAHAVDRAAA